jgi:cell division protein FtsI/penicillin-binding protein 2
MFHKHGIIKNSHKENSAARITIVAALFFFLAALVGLRLFYLQVIRHGYFQDMGDNQRGSLKKILPSRGLIYATNKEGENLVVADNKELYLLFAIPPQIKDATATVDALNKIWPLEQSEREKIWRQLQKTNDPYEPLRHYLTSEEKNKIEDFKIAGLNFSPETKRYYPEKNVFAHLTGFVGFVGDTQVGSYGLEESFEKDLKGKNGEVKLERDPSGRLIGVGDFEIEPAVNGSDLYLTIDRQAQFKVCAILDEYVKKFEAEGGSAIIQDPNTGAVLALCDNPNFDPNIYGQVENSRVYTNQAVVSLFEPGSVFKAFTMAAALDSGAVTPDTTYEDKGVLVFGKDTVKNAADKIYGRANMTQVLENSINTGAVFAAEHAGRENIKRYFSNFGFGVKTGIELPGETKGDLSSLNKTGAIYLATASFGQGISVTPLQILNGFSAIANGGILYKPFVIKKTVSANGQITETKVTEIRRVISERTANVLKAMLVSVVENGHAKPARVSGYYVGGKTGTAEIPSPQGGYLNAYNHSFVGFAPAGNPRFTVLVKITNPKMRFAESTAAPAFAEIMKFLLNYYQVPTER